MNDVSALFEIFPICQKFLLNTIDIPSMDLTKTQILILFALSGGRSLNMSQLSSYLASSKEQATRAVSPLVKDEYVTRFRSDENRKMVYVKLTEKGNQLILQEKALVKEYLSKRFESLSKEDQELFHQSLSNILTILKKIDRKSTRMKADLHCHTVLSDGAMRVDQIIPYAKRIGLDYIAISDHESTHSIPEAVRLGKELGVHAGSFHDGIYWNSDRSIT